MTSLTTVLRLSVVLVLPLVVGYSVMNLQSEVDSFVGPFRVCCDVLAGFPISTEQDTTLTHSDETYFLPDSVPNPSPPVVLDSQHVTSFPTATQCVFFKSGRPLADSPPVGSGLELWDLPLLCLVCGSSAPFSNAFQPFCDLGDDGVDRVCVYPDATTTAVTPGRHWPQSRSLSPPVVDVRGPSQGSLLTPSSFRSSSQGPAGGYLPCLPQGCAGLPVVGGLRCRSRNPNPRMGWSRPSPHRPGVLFGSFAEHRCDVLTGFRHGRGTTLTNIDETSLLPDSVPDPSPPSTPTTINPTCVTWRRWPRSRSLFPLVVGVGGPSQSSLLPPSSACSGGNAPRFVRSSERGRHQPSLPQARTGLPVVSGGRCRWPIGALGCWHRDPHPRMAWSGVLSGPTWPNLNLWWWLIGAIGLLVWRLLLGLVLSATTMHHISGPGSSRPLAPSRRTSVPLTILWMVSVALLSGPVGVSALPSSVVCHTITTVLPSNTTVSLCATPWDVSLGAEPAAGVDSVTVHVVFLNESSFTNLVLSPEAPATVNGVAVGDSFIEAGGGEYSVTFPTSPGDGVLWPWRGLAVSLSFESGLGAVVAEVASRMIPGATVSESSASLGMSGFGHILDRGVCFGDVNGDGWVDMFVARATGALNQLWMNGGDGTSFSESASEWGVGDAASDNSHGCGFADIDGDGDIDLFVSERVSTNLLYVNNGKGFTEEWSARGVADGGDSLGVVWGDVDGDGDVDLFVCQYGSANGLYMNDGSGVFVNEAAIRRVDTSLLSQQAVMFDVDGDGWLDIAVVNFGGANELFVNNGAAVFAGLGSSFGWADTGQGLGVSVADMTGDGVLDVYVTNFDSRDLLCIGDGGGVGVFSEEGVARGMGASTGDNIGVSSLDVGHDGATDVVVGVQAGLDLMWVNDGVGVFAESTSALGLVADTGRTFAVSVADVDGDGDLDMVFGDSGFVYVSHDAHPSVRNWIKVRPLTAGGAQSAFGATVRLVCVDGCGEDSVGWSGVRVIDGGSGFYSQSGYDAHFGVPVPSATYNVSVTWPGHHHGPSNWTTHPGLGSIVPSSLSVSGALLVVRPEAVVVSVGFVSPWGYGSVDRDPLVGDSVTIPIVVSPSPASSLDIGVVSASVNGVDVSSSWGWDESLESYVVTYSTPSEDRLWPWRGLSVSVWVVDGGGVVSTARTKASADALMTLR